MQYGRPTLFALQSLWRSVRTQFGFDWHRSYEIYRFWHEDVFVIAFQMGMLLGIAFAFGSVERITGNDVLGHYALFETPPPPSAPNARITGLMLGHRCLQHQVVGTSNAAMCLGFNARPVQYPLELEPGWKTSCCVRVAPRSNDEALAVTRRFFLSANHALGGQFATHLLGFAVAIVVALVLVYLALLVLISVTAMGFFLRAVVSSGSAIARLWKSMSVAGRLLEVHEWPPGEVKGAFAVHLTDLHITEGTPYELMVDPAGFAGARAPTCEQIDARLASILAQIPAHNPLAIALTGDITDSGDEEEWKRFGATWIKQFGQRSSMPVWLAPGNHDISFNRGERPDPSGEAKREKEWRYLMAEAIATGQLTIESIGRVTPSGAIEIRAAKARSKAMLKRAIASGVVRMDSAGKFPRKATLDLQGTLVNVVTLNSCTYNSHFVLSNAVGKLGEDQLDLLREHLDNLNGPLLVLLHHHLALPRGRISLLRPLHSAQELMKLPVDARELVSILGRYAQSNPVLVLHGHQHENLRFYIDQLEGGRIHVFGLASSTLGCVQFDPVTGRHALDGQLRIGVIGFDPDSGWSAEARVLPFTHEPPASAT